MLLLPNMLKPNRFDLIVSFSFYLSFNFDFYANAFMS